MIMMITLKVRLAGVYMRSLTSIYYGSRCISFAILAYCGVIRSSIITIRATIGEITKLRCLNRQQRAASR